MKSKVDELKEAMAAKQKRDDAAEAAASEAASSDDAGFEADLTAAKEDARQHYDKLLRVMAEYENFKKRTIREKQELLKYGTENILKDMLVVMDGLEEALKHLPKGASKDVETFVTGIELVHKQFQGALEKNGLVAVATANAPFDPAIHEAIAHLPSTQVATGMVLDVHKKGYQFHDRLLRPAMVTVSTGGETLT